MIGSKTRTMDIDDTIRKQVELMYDTVTKTLHTIDEKDMVVSALIYRTVRPYSLDIVNSPIPGQ